MRYIVPIIEQMSRAADELASTHPVHHRLGYILVDNAAELIVHKYARHQAEMQRTWVAQPVLTEKQIRMARKGKFDDKLNILVLIGAITDPERRFASICHEYRNQVYHTGLRHEDALHAIGGAYFRWCCDLFGRFEPPFYGSSSNENPTPKAQTLIDLIKREQDVSFVPRVEQIAPYLLSMCPATPNLAETLTALAGEAIDEVKSNINFIQSDAPRKLTVAEIVRDSQESWDVNQLLEREGLEGDILWRDEPRLERRNQIYSEFVAQFKPRFRQVPFSSWRSRCNVIAKQPTEILTLNRYQDLRDSMVYLESAIQEMAFQLDMWIQHQIDIMRGK